MKNINILMVIAVNLICVKANPELKRFEGMVPNLGSMPPQMQQQGGNQDEPVVKIESLEQQLEEDLKNPIDLGTELDKKLDALLQSAAADPNALDFIWQMALTNSLLPLINDKELGAKI